MTGLTIIVTRADPVALRNALTLAAAAAALGGRARVHLHEEAVALLRAPIDAPDDTGRAEAGMPGLRATMATAFELGIAVIACQAGLALADMRAGELPPAVEVGGLVGLFASLGDDRLVTL